MAKVRSGTRAIYAGLALSMLALFGSTASTLVFRAAGKVDGHTTAMLLVAFVSLFVGIMTNFTMTLAAYREVKGDRNDTGPIWV